MHGTELFQTHPILVTGAAGGTQGSTGRLVASLLLKQGIAVRALVHKLDVRSDELRTQGAEVVEGDLLNPASVQAEMQDVKRAYFTYPVADGLLEAAAICSIVSPIASSTGRGSELFISRRRPIMKTSALLSVGASPRKALPLCRGEKIRP